LAAGAIAAAVGFSFVQLVDHIHTYWRFLEAALEAEEAEAEGADPA